MKKTLAIFSILFAVFFIKVQTAIAQHGHPTSPPTTTDPSTYKGSLVPMTYNPSAYPSATQGEFRLYENNGPALGSSFASFGIAAPVGGYSTSTDINLSTLFPQFLSGGAYNDKARAVAFVGTLLGKTFTFYDDPSKSTSDDYTQIFFYKNPPAGYGYFLWTFEASYTDGYAIVTYHRVNGLDGKVSNIYIF